LGETFLGMEQLQLLARCLLSLTNPVVSSILNKLDPEAVICQIIVFIGLTVSCKGQWLFWNGGGADSVVNGWLLSVLWMSA